MFCEFKHFAVFFGGGGEAFLSKEYGIITWRVKIFAVWKISQIILHDSQLLPHLTKNHEGKLKKKKKKAWKTLFTMFFVIYN